MSASSVSTFKLLKSWKPSLFPAMSNKQVACKLLYRNTFCIDV